MDSFDDLIPEFLAESRQSLESVESDFVRIETQGPDAETIGKIFRVVHSIKGSCGVLGLRPIGEVSHHAESLLDLIRSGVTSPTAELIDVLLRSVDMLKAMIDAPDVGESISYGELVNELDMHVKRIHNGGVSAGATATSGRSNWQPDASALSSIKASRRNGNFCFYLSVVLGEQRKGTTYTAGTKGLVDGLLTVGKILHSDSIAANEVGAPHVHMVFDTVLDLDLMSATFLLSGSEIQLFDDAFGALQSDSGANNKPGASVATEVAVVDSLRQVKEAVAAKPAVEKAAVAVSKEPRHASDASQPTMRIGVRFLDDLLRHTGNLVMARNQLVTRFNFADDPAFATLTTSIVEAHKAVVQTRMQPVGSLFDRFHRVVRDISRKLGKEVELALDGTQIQLDRTVIESFADPLTHLVRNSLDHGLETPDVRTAAGKSPSGLLTLRAYLEGGDIVFQVKDDGRGLNTQAILEKAISKNLVSAKDAEKLADAEIHKFIFAAGFSTKEAVTELSGRGVGMDVVRTNIEALGGRIEIQSELGKGCAFHARVPLTRALVASSMIPALLVRLGSHLFAIPQSSVNELLTLDPRNPNDRLRTLEGQNVYQLRDIILPVIHLEDALGIERSFVATNSSYRQEGKETSLIVGKDRRKLPSEMTEEESESERNHEGQRKSKSVLLVLEFRKKLFGVLVDKIEGLEEIVVRPLPTLVQSCQVFAGHTMLGDGKLILIIDVNGVVERMQLSFDQKEKVTRVAQSTVGPRTMRQQMLLFNFSKDEYYAVPLELVSLVTKIDVSAIDTVGPNEFYCFKNKVYPLLRLNKFLNVKPIESDVSEAVLILPARLPYDIGILANRDVRTIDISDTFDSSIEVTDGIIGAFKFEGRLTMLLDLYTLFERHSPDHFDRAGNDCVPAKILYAEDSPFFQQLVRKYLDTPGREVVVVDDGRAALDELQRRPDYFDLVLSDIEMPRMTGLELCRAIRSDPSLRSLAVIALTSLAQEDAIRRGMDAGFDEYAVKIDRQKLLNVINSHLVRTGRKGRGAVACAP